MNKLKIIFRNTAVFLFVFSSAILLAQNYQAMLKFSKFWIIITKTA
jgi:hypothetical protein